MDDGRVNTVEEILIKYKREPEIRELWVEGNEDKEIFSYYFKKNHIMDIKVYSINNVKINEQHASGLGLEIHLNNRNKLITLAYQFNLKSVNSLNALCIVDLDFDDLLDRKYSWPNLIYTDYSSIEMYLFNQDVLEKFFTLVFRGFKCSVNQVYNELAKILPEFFLIRATNIFLNLNMRWLDITRCCSCKKCTITLNEEEHVRRYLNMNSKTKYFEGFKKNKEELRKNIKKDPRQQIRGHDYMELLSFFIKSNGTKDHKAISKPEFVKRSLLGCLEMEFIEHEPLFISLNNWANQTI